MTKPRRLDTDRRKQFALKCWVAENLRNARLEPKEGMSLSYRAAAKELSMDSGYLSGIEYGKHLPRFRRALTLAKWIRSRLQIEVADSVL